LIGKISFLNQDGLQVIEKQRQFWPLQKIFVRLAAAWFALHKSISAMLWKKVKIGDRG